MRNILLVLGLVAAIALVAYELYALGVVLDIIRVIAAG